MKDTYPEYTLEKQDQLTWDDAVATKPVTMDIQYGSSTSGPYVSNTFGPLTNGYDTTLSDE